MKKATTACLALCLSCAATFAQKADWDRKKSQYGIEEGARLRIAVDDAAWASSIVSLWNLAHPEASGAVECLVMGTSAAIAAIEAGDGSAPDAALVYQHDAVRRRASLLPIDPVLSKAVQAQAAQEFLKVPGSGGLTFIPISYEGMVFFWNRTMLEELGFDASDKNSDGLPDSFDTWEEILSLAESWKTNRPVYRGAPVNEVFPFCLEDPWSGFSGLSAGGWRIFLEGEALNPGFSSPTFRSGLDFLKAASEACASAGEDGERLRGSACSWRWDMSLDGRASPFGLAGTWMDVRGAERRGGFDLRFAPMPTWRKARAAPFIRSKGFVVRAGSPFPSAVHEILRLLYTKQGMQAMMESSSRLPALSPRSSLRPVYPAGCGDLPDMAAALAFGQREPILSLPRDPERDAMGVYYGIGVNLALRALWDGAKGPEETQAILVAKAERWLLDNNVGREPGPSP